jgi:intracellular septation protein A
MKVNSDKQYTIFAHKLQSAKKLMEEFLKIYCELYKICKFCVTNLSLKHEIKNKLKFAESHFFFFITMHNDFVFVHSSSSVSITVQN